LHFALVILQFAIGSDGGRLDALRESIKICAPPPGTVTPIVRISGREWLPEAQLRRQVQRDKPANLMPNPPISGWSG
jgi:hypothetical protein